MNRASIKETLLEHRPVLAFWFVLITFIISVSFFKIIDVDVWWHIQLGKSMLQNCGLPDLTAYYFSPITHDLSNLRFTWLGDILLYLTHWIGGDLGLQVLRILVVTATCVILLSILRQKYNWWYLVVMMLLLVGIYQKQVVRNSLFALVFTAGLFWIWVQVRHRGRQNWVWCYPLLIGVWGCIHGSYLIGFGLLVLLFAGDTIDTIRGINRDRSRLIVKYALVITLSLAAISLWNPATKKYILLTGAASIRSVASVSVGDLVSEASAAEKLDLADLGLKKVKKRVRRAVKPETFAGKIKWALNNTVVKTWKQDHTSGDFISPFDMLHRLYVKIGMLFAAGGLLLILFASRPLRFSHLLPFAAIVVLGLGYLRMVGYVPIAAVAILFICIDSAELRWDLFKNTPRSRTVSRVVAGVLLLAMFLNLALGFPLPLGTRMHAFGLGRIPVYADILPERILSEAEDRNVFTTITTGGYLLHKWHPHKKVFIDGHFAPHSKGVFQDYSKLVDQTETPEMLYDKYHIQSALVESTSSVLNRPFLNSPNWYPRYIDRCMVYYIYRPDFRSDIPLPEVLNAPDEIDSLPAFYRRSAARFLYRIPEILLDRGRLADAAGFLERNRPLLNNLKDCAAPQQLEILDERIAGLGDTYGMINKASIGFESRYQDAVRKGDRDGVIKTGQALIDVAPDKLQVALDLAREFSLDKQVAQSQKYLRLIYGQRKMDPGFWEANKKSLAEIYLNLFLIRLNEQKIVAAYQLLGRAYLIDSETVPAVKLYQSGIKITKELIAAGHLKKAFSVFRRMEKDFPDSGRLANEIAWFIVSQADDDYADFQDAKAYALKAVAIMEKQKDPILDMGYDTLAEVYFKLKKYSQMRKFEEKALQNAPAERKHLYKRRQPAEGR